MALDIGASRRRIQMMERTVKTLATIGLAGIVAIGAPLSASAFSFSPPDSYGKLKGKLTLFPDDGAPFACKVVMRVFTGKGTSINQLPKIISARTTATAGNCHAIIFNGFPWLMGASSLTTGGFGPLTFTGFGNCSAPTTTFSDNAGVWTIPTGGCIAGTLTSTPPITIVP
jgi:hypothetical protein